MSHNDDFLMHYGVGKLDGSPGRGSGRYPLGSGKNPNQHSGDFISRVEDLRKKGKSDTEIAHDLNLSTTQFRVQIAIANEGVSYLPRLDVVEINAVVASYPKSFVDGVVGQRSHEIEQGRMGFVDSQSANDARSGINVIHSPAPCAYPQPSLAVVGKRRDRVVRERAVA